MTFDFLVDTYETERLKTLSVWAQVPDEAFDERPEPRARSPHEHMVHQCTSEDGWMRTMLGVAVGLPPLPPEETKGAFLRTYAEASGRRLAALREKPDAWFLEPTRFFDAERPRAWVLVRRFTHTTHHRGQLTALLRARGVPLASTYGPTADTGGLAANGGRVLYRAPDVTTLLEREARGEAGPALPGPGTKPPTERPGGR